MFIARPPHVLAQSGDGITLSGICYWRDTLSHTNRPMAGANVVLVSKTDQSRQNYETGTSGSFHFILQPGKEYYILAKKKGYLNSIKETISTIGMACPATLYHDIRILMYSTIDYKWIYYSGSDDTELNKEAKRLLDTMYWTLIEYPNFVIEVGSHTDCRAIAQHCDSISLQRALVAKAYLVAKGIDSARLVPHGYGKTQPVNNCGCAPYKDSSQIECTFNENMANNRTTLKVLRTDYKGKQGIIESEKR